MDIPTVSHWIGGIETATLARFACNLDPATGVPNRRVAIADSTEIDLAVVSASRAQPAWDATPAPRRAQVLFAMREIVRRDIGLLARMIGEEHGKTIADAEGEIQRGLDVIEFACGAPHLLKGEHSRNVGGGIDIISEREAVGVVAGITPFNFPVMIPLWMGAVAVAAGCAFINKPSERDPSSAVQLGRMWREAGLPDGIWTVLNGDRDTATALLRHPGVDAVSFVGSTPAAADVYRSASEAGKRVQAFGGAKNHMVIMPDANLEQAADALVAAAFGSAGQRCMAISVAVPVGAETADRLVKLLADRLARIRVSTFDDPAADMGPLITRAAAERVEGLIQSASDAGAAVVVDGRGLLVADDNDGFFVGPTLIDYIVPSMAAYVQEIFGPVLLLSRVSSLDAAIRLIEESPYGNGVAIFTSCGDSARRFTRAIKVGMVGVNVAIPVPMAFHHFGGWKQSSFGDSQMYGPDAFKFFTRLRTISQRWPSAIHATTAEASNLAFTPGR